MLKVAFCVYTPVTIVVAGFIIANNRWDRIVEYAARIAAKRGLL